jgi:DnaJ-class molecular chaperone
MLNDPYETLGLTRSATADDIKKAYRKLVRTSHPDLHPDDPDAEARFKAIGAAHDILKDPETRARFDAGEIDASGAERPQRQYYRDFADASDTAYRQGRGFGPEADPADIFAEILRNRRAHGDAFTDRGFSARGADARYTLEVPFLDAARGAKTRIQLPDGQSLAVKIPRGTEDGQTLRLRGKGMPGYGGGPAGDALITVFLRPHPVFRREGDDILVTLPITIDEAVLGARVTAPTIHGPVSLTIPPRHEFRPGPAPARARDRPAGGKGQGRPEGRDEGSWCRPIRTRPCARSCPSGARAMPPTRGPIS